MILDARHIPSAREAAEMAARSKRKGIQHTIDLIGKMIDDAANGGQYSATIPPKFMGGLSVRNVLDLYSMLVKKGYKINGSTVSWPKPVFDLTPFPPIHVMKLLTILIALALAASNVSAQTPEVSYTYKAKVIRIVDGDTLDLLIDLGFDVWVRQRVRLLDVYAAEKKEENGLAHMTRLAGLLPADSLCVIKTTKDKTDKYGRVLGEVWNSRLFVNDAMRRTINTPQGKGLPKPATSAPAPVPVK